MDGPCAPGWSQRRSPLRSVRIEPVPRFLEGVGRQDDLCGAAAILIETLPVHLGAKREYKFGQARQDHRSSRLVLFGARAARQPSSRAGKRRAIPSKLVVGPISTTASDILPVSITAMPSAKADRIADVPPPVARSELLRPRPRPRQPVRLETSGILGAMELKLSGQGFELVEHRAP